MNITPEQFSQAIAHVWDVAERYGKTLGDPDFGSFDTLAFPEAPYTEKSMIAFKGERFWSYGGHEYTYGEMPIRLIFLSKEDLERELGAIRQEWLDTIEESKRAARAAELESKRNQARHLLSAAKQLQAEIDEIEGKENSDA